MEQDNGWYERGELPPVGAECEFKVGNFWKKCEIKGEGFDYGIRVVLAQVGEQCPCVASASLFRPLKTERQKFVERAKNDFKDYASSFYDRLWDSGLRYTE